MASVTKDICIIVATQLRMYINHMLVNRTVYVSDDKNYIISLTDSSLRY